MLYLFIYGQYKKSVILKIVFLSFLAFTPLSLTLQVLTHKMCDKFSRIKHGQWPHNNFILNATQGKISPLWPTGKHYY